MSRRDSPASRAGRHGFTLLELSIVLALIGVITGMGLVTFTASLQASQYNATVTRMDEIEKALLNYAVANNRIPCPADLTLTTASANYGLEAGAMAGGTATGECVTGMTPAANSKSVSGAEEGGVPTRALQLPDEYMYDGWGRKFRYAVDPTMTKASALPYPIGGLCSASTSVITVNDASGAARTTAGIYALISHGANGHGAYTSNGVVLNAGSVNANEQTNCHCDSTGAATTYTPTYVETVPTQDPANALDNFDDIVTFKEGWQMQAQNYPLVAKLQCMVIYVTDINNYRVQKFTTSGTYLSQFGSYGTGNGQFSGAPTTIALDSSGNVYVVDYGYRVEKFDSNGNYLLQFGSYGSGNGQFQYIFGMNVDSSGNIYVEDALGYRVEKFNSSGTYLSQLGCASGPCAGGSGNGQFANNGYYSSNILTDSSNNVYVVDGGNCRVQKFDSNGNYLLQFGTCEASGGLFSAGLQGIAFDPSGNVVVMDWHLGVIAKYTPSGVFISDFTFDVSGGSGNGQFNGAEILTIDSSGNLWITDRYNNRVQELSSTGTYMSQFGSSGSGNGQFNQAYGIAISSR